MRFGEINTLLEAYEDRVRQVGDEVIHRYAGPAQSSRGKVTKTDLQWYIDHVRETMNFPLGSVTPEEFTRDVIAYLAPKLKMARAESPRSKIIADLVERMTRTATDMIGDIFPDGDPGDIKESLYRKYSSSLSRLSGYHDYQWYGEKLWPKIERLFRKQNGGKDMWAYMADIYDDQVHSMAVQAAQQRLEVEPFLRANGLDPHHNPYRHH